MKKYIAFFAILLLTMFLTAKLVRAEDGNRDSSNEDSVKVESSDDNEKSEVSNQDDDKDGISDSEDLDDDGDGIPDTKDSRPLDRNNDGINDNVDRVKSEEVKQQIQTAREEAKTKMQLLKESIKSEKDAAKAKAKELRITGREKALVKFDAAVLRISTLLDKVNAQIAKLGDKGLDTTKAIGFATTSETKLAAAKAKIVEINTLLSASINELSKEDKAKLVTLTQEAQTLTKDAQLALVSAVKSLKDAVNARIEELKQILK